VRGLQTKIEELQYVNQVLRTKENEREQELDQIKEQMLKHHSVMVDILDKFEVLEKGQKNDVAKKLIDSGMYIPK
jgi:glycine cleavage system protein P-like pyridoxal-binding family